MKLYFENEDSEICYPLNYHIENAKEEGLNEIELFEAIPDTTNKDIIWCSELETTGEKSECNKTCPYYTAPEKGRICKNRGNLMAWGDSVKFSVETSQPTHCMPYPDPPETRVRFYPTDTDETFDGTVIEEKPNFYVVVPDQNLMLRQNWDKKRCDVIR